jgi:signal peptidase II
VIDFIDFSQWHFPWVFNIADAAINVGVALILCDAVFAPRKVAAG